MSIPFLNCQAELAQATSGVNTGCMGCDRAVRTVGCEDPPGRGRAREWDGVCCPAEALRARNGFAGRRARMRACRASWREAALVA
eukprot:6206070-Pleurochrysis_carterae.AAC.1